MLNWTKEGNTYVAQGQEEDSGEDVKLTVEDTGYKGRPWEVRAAGGVVGYSKTLKEGKELALMYCERGLSNEGNERR